MLPRQDNHEWTDHREWTKQPPPAVHVASLLRSWTFHDTDSTTLATATATIAFLVDAIIAMLPAFLRARARQTTPSLIIRLWVRPFNSIARAVLWRHFTWMSVSWRTHWVKTEHFHRRYGATQVAICSSLSWTGSYLQTMDGYLPAFLHSDGESTFRQYHFFILGIWIWKGIEF